MEINFSELWHNMGFPVRAVVIVLTIQAVACVAVVIDRLIMLTQSNKRARGFAGGLQTALEGESFDQALHLAENAETNHLASYISAGLRSFVTRIAAGDERLRAAELAKRALERKGDAISRELNRGMNVLASTGSTAPF